MNPCSWTFQKNCLLLPRARGVGKKVGGKRLKFIGGGRFDQRKLRKIAGLHEKGTISKRVRGGKKKGKDIDNPLLVEIRIRVLKRNAGKRYEIFLLVATELINEESGGDRRPRKISKPARDVKIRSLSPHEFFRRTGIG